MGFDGHTRNFVLLMALVTMLSVFIAFSARPPKIDNRKVQAIQETQPSMKPSEDVKNGIHVPTGLIADKDYQLVVNNCTACHAADLVIQNRQTAKGWKTIIEWMQEKQNLWDLGENESRIIAYLAKNYAPQKEGRRKNLNLQKEDWYVLE